MCDRILIGLDPTECDDLGNNLSGHMNRQVRPLVVYINIERLVFLFRYTSSNSVSFTFNGKITLEFEGSYIGVVYGHCIASSHGVWTRQDKVEHTGRGQTSMKVYTHVSQACMYMYVHMYMCGLIRPFIRRIFFN